MLEILCPSVFSQNHASAAGIEVFSPVSHTLFNPADIIQKVSLNVLFYIRTRALFLFGICCLVSLLVSFFSPSHDG